MPTVTGPLMSVSASGSLSDTLTFRRTARGHVCRKYSKPTGDPTAAQTRHRAFVQWLTQRWAAVSPTTKATWQTLADMHTFSTFNAFCKTNIERWTAGQAPTDTGDPIPTAQYMPMLSLVGEGGPTAAKLTIAPTTIQQNKIASVHTAPLSPDATGTYYFIGPQGPYRGYLRPTPTPFRLLFHATSGAALIYPRNNWVSTGGKWDNLGNEWGPLDPTTPCTGWVTLTDDDDPDQLVAAPAAAIYRSQADFFLPSRDTFVAIVTLDVNGEATFLDYPPRDILFYYTAVSLSCDGRQGLPTTMAEAYIAD